MMQSTNNFVRSKPAQAFSVSCPTGGRIGGDAPIVVEVYALGRGITLVGQRGDLELSQDAFELEANGKIFVFDPRFGSQPDRLVAPVEGDVAAIRLPVKAVDQKHLTELRFARGGHSVSPLKTAILSMPQGMGKSQMGAELADWLGCRSVVDEWNFDQPLVVGALHLTNDVVWEGGAA